MRKLRNKLAIVLGFVAASVGVLGIVNAVGEGQIERGDFYYSRNLTTGSAFGDPTAANQCDELQYRVRLHNPGASAVTNVNVRVNLPAGASTQNVSTATVTAENAFPASVSDTATVNLSSAQSIAYVSGSTQLLNAGGAVISNLPDGITSGGVNVGTVDVSINEIRFVQFKAKVNCQPPPPTPVFKCDVLEITKGDDRKVTISNFATTAQNGAVFRNVVINWGDNSAPMTIANPVGQMHQYSSDGPFTIVATAHFTVDGQDKTATSPACQKEVSFKPVPPKPVFSCDELDVSATKDRKVTITKFSTTARNGATFKTAVITWGDNSSPLTDSSPVGQTHTYSSDGTFTITATAHFTVNGKEETANGPQCQKQVTFKKDQPPNVTPVTPGQGAGTTSSPSSSSTSSSSSPSALVNTGPGEVAGLFTAVSAFGALGHRWMISRRLERE